MIRTSVASGTGLKFFSEHILSNRDFDKNLKPFKRWFIQQIDKEFLMEQAGIAIKEYEKILSRTYQGPNQNVLGLVAEFAFDGLLEMLGAKYVWNKREKGHWEEKEVRPWDFQLDNGLTFEIGSARPHHGFAILKDRESKTKSAIFVQVRIEHLECVGQVYWKGMERYFQFSSNCKDAYEIKDSEEFKKLQNNESKNWAVADIVGFDEIPRIIKQDGQWRYKDDRSPPCTEVPGWYEPLRTPPLRSFDDLSKLIKESTIQKTLFNN
jgi:hypothetical protein